MLGMNRSQIEKEPSLALAREIRLTRRWWIFFRLLTFGVILLVVFASLDWRDTMGRHTALVNLKGTIASNDVNADDMIAGLQAAFADKNTAGVILRINSPGGSPVQAGQIYDEIRRLRKLHPRIPLYVVVDDICASGGYYVAAAADRIYVNKASLVGSIGVLMDGFGFTGLMNKAGVDRRLLTAGANKGFLDPFSPVNPQQQAYAQTMLDDIHQQFISAVRRGRGSRLKETPDMFSGLIWTGQRSVAMGLADGFGTVDSVARDVIHADTVVDYTPEQNLSDRFSRKLGMTLAQYFSPQSLSGWVLR